MQKLSFTWLGHSTFLFRSPGGRRILTDPWLTTNPACPESLKKIAALDLILITHGHSDHSADAVAVARATGAAAIAPYELAEWLQQRGLSAVIHMNPGGTIDVLGLSISMVPAFHSSSVEDNGRMRYAGCACGYVVRFEDGLTIYFAGDTALFGDMRLIAEIYHPAVAFLPIGDVYTMGPDQAAIACELLAVKQVVPMHYGTWPVLSGRPERLRELVASKGVQVLELKPGETAG
jgi:L-ascorbate metabolism protein UlaG (beta-lactamase superfamily)